ncbi:hypothetical protein [Enterobacter huaxiensis]
MPNPLRIPPNHRQRRRHAKQQRDGGKENAEKQFPEIVDGEFISGLPLAKFVTAQKYFYQTFRIHFYN